MRLHFPRDFSIVVSLRHAAILTLCTGSITQWGEVSKGKKDRSRSKAKENITTTLGETSTGPRTSRGGRAAHEGGRGGRGRGTDRGRGGRGRGGANAHTNGARAKEASELSVPTEESTAWDVAPKSHDGQDAPETTKPAETWSGVAMEAASTTAAAAAKITSSVIQDGAKKSWASMFKNTPTAAPKKEPSTVQKYIYSPLISLRAHDNNSAGHKVPPFQSLLNLNPRKPNQRLWCPNQSQSCRCSLKMSRRLNRQSSKSRKHQLRHRRMNSLRKM
jgi:hypothetical protein